MPCGARNALSLLARTSPVADMAQGNALVEPRYKMPVASAAWAWEADNIGMAAADPVLRMDTGMAAAGPRMGKRPYGLMIDLPRSR